MKNIFAYLILCNLLILNNLKAQGKFEFSPLARLAYESVLALRFDEAKARLAQMRQTEAGNLILPFIENYQDCIQIFISEDKKAYDFLKKNEEKRGAILRGGDAASPYYLFAQAQVKLLWAMNKAKFGDYLDAFNGASAAFELLEKNKKKFPDFMPNKMSLGVLHAIVGAIPDNYKWGLKLVSGMNGTIEKGQAEIEEVIRYAKTNDYVFEQEALVLYAFLMLHLGKQNDDAWTIINTPKLKPRENALAAFALANVAMRTGRNDKAIEILQNRPTTTAYFPFPYLDYMLGLAKMYRGDTDADGYLKRFVQNFQGRNYIKECYQRLAWQDLLRGQIQDYQHWQHSVKSQGRADIGGDKNALKEANSGIAPEPSLLRARLLFDGGYFQKAFQFLKTKQENDFQSQADKLEYNYRMGRILQLQKKKNEAIAYFDRTIQAGKSTKYYYACNAALQLGTIYETNGQTAKAREFYQFCLSLKPDDHADGLHAKAKAGLSRLKK